MTSSTDSDYSTPTTALLDEPQPQAPAAEAAQRPRSSRYQSLDMWRGAACLMLVLYHATFYASHTWKSSDPSTWTLGGFAINVLGRMWIGVPIFFVVSGYCIAASSDASRRRTHSLRTYFSRRFRRIYPPLWIACGLCVAWPARGNFRVDSPRLPPIASTGRIYSGKLDRQPDGD